jgi:hypothetical protein
MTFGGRTGIIGMDEAHEAIDLLLGSEVEGKALSAGGLLYESVDPEFAKWEQLYAAYGLSYEVQEEFDEPVQNAEILRDTLRARTTSEEGHAHIYRQIDYELERAEGPVFSFGGDRLEWMQLRTHMIGDFTAFMKNLEGWFAINLDKKLRARIQVKLGDLAKLEGNYARIELAVPVFEVHGRVDGPTTVYLADSVLHWANPLYSDVQFRTIIADAILNADKASIPELDRFIEDELWNDAAQLFLSLGDLYAKRTMEPGGFMEFEH